MERVKYIRKKEIVLSNV